MKKELFLVVGVLGVLSLSACDARDEKQINAAIKDKSDAEIVQMVVDANKEETLTDVYSDGLKLDGEFKMKGDLAALESSSGFGSVTASGSLDISGDISGVYNASGVQASANVKAKINMKTVVTEGVTTETKIDLKGSATAELLNDEADAYLYAKISGTAASTKLDQEYKYKFKRILQTQVSVILYLILIYQKLILLNLKQYLVVHLLVLMMVCYYSHGKMKL